MGSRCRHGSCRKPSTRLSNLPSAWPRTCKTTDPISTSMDFQLPWAVIREPCAYLSSPGEAGSWTHDAWLTWSASIVSQLASLLDLNTLHSLSRTCRQFRVNLLQFRDQLVTQSLRCSNEDAQLDAAPSDRQREPYKILRRNEWPGPRITSGKVGKCARDMVGECKRCGTVICRVSKHPNLTKTTPPMI